MYVVWYLLAQAGTRLPSPCHGANLLEGSEVQSVSTFCLDQSAASLTTGGSVGSLSLALRLRYDNILPPEPLIVLLW